MLFKDELFIVMLAFLLKISILGASLNEALCFVALSAVFSFNHYLKIKQVRNEVQEQIDEIKKTLAETKSGVDSLRLERLKLDSLPKQQNYRF